MSRRVKIIFGASIVAVAVFGWCCIWLINWRFIENPKEETRDLVYKVRKYQIREQIYKYSSFPDSSFDYRYDRVYTITDNSWFPMELARFEYTDRRNIGIKTAYPKMVGDWLVIFSDRQTFLWKPNHQPIKFTPNETYLPELAESPISVYPAKSKNIYLDYQAMNFSIQGNRWLFEYHCDRNCQDKLNNQLPPKLECLKTELKLSISNCKIVTNTYKNTPKVIFFSNDLGKTFQIFNR
jgi:hypothetical protein